MDLILAFVLEWPLKTVLFFFPFIAFIYVGSKHGLKVGSLFLLSMIISSAYGWMLVGEILVFWPQIMVYLICIGLLLCDWILIKRKKRQEINDQDKID